MSSIAVFSLLSLLVFSFISWLSVKWIMRVSKRISWIQRSNKWIVITYLGILLLSVIVYELLPENNLKVITEREVQLLQKENDEFELAFKNGEVNKLDPKFLVKEWTQELKGETLNINAIHLNGTRPRVYVEWIDSKEDHVEVKLYQTNINMHGIDLNEKISIINIEWEDDQVVMKSPANQEIRYYTFSNDLAFLPFLDLEIGEHRKEARGFTYVHLKVPKQINVVDEMGLQFY